MKLGFSHKTVMTAIKFYTCLLTPWCRVLLEKLNDLQLVKKFSAFHGTRRFITALTTVRHLSVSWASPIQSIYPHPTSWRSILILSTHPHTDRTSQKTQFVSIRKASQLIFRYTIAVCDSNCAKHTNTPVWSKFIFFSQRVVYIVTTGL